MHLALLVGGILVFAAAPGAAQPPDVQFLTNTVSTDLLLAESKEPIHWLRLQCRLADGGKGTLTLNPTVPKFNEFGDPVAGGKPSPKVTLDCTLKFIKEDKGRRLFEVRGPKIDTRLSLVVEKDIAPWGTAGCWSTARTGRFGAWSMSGSPAPNRSPSRNLRQSSRWEGATGFYDSNPAVISVSGS